MPGGAPRARGAASVGARFASIDEDPVRAPAAALTEANAAWARRSSVVAPGPSGRQPGGIARWPTDAGEHDRLDQRGDDDAGQGDEEAELVEAGQHPPIVAAGPLAASAGRRGIVHAAATQRPASVHAGGLRPARRMAQLLRKPRWYTEACTTVRPARDTTHHEGTAMTDRHDSSRRRALAQLSAGSLATLAPWALQPASAQARPLTVGVIYVGPRDDFGYNQAQAQAAAEIKKMPGIKVVEEENVPETTAVQKTMTGMVQQDGAKLLFPTSFGYFDPHMLAARAQVRRRALLALRRPVDRGRTRRTPAATSATSTSAST